MALCRLRIMDRCRKLLAGTKAKVPSQGMFWDVPPLKLTVLDRDSHTPYYSHH